eukprot:CAMPEP_0178386240 /NCGR_PEP_ID=MMETSP0689_2-20121128/8457_1 /TAXON_ID=160604 /ORGANISM="Amphidinium massartii, Strain CS-259" /LENGTH=60 /DNA_ID=CAMNT_0020006569 /DNA_START=523 /DNA_END=701 /DNA_ORIENTATION=-
MKTGSQDPAMSLQLLFLALEAGTCWPTHHPLPHHAAAPAQRLLRPSLRLGAQEEHMQHAR